MNQNTNNNKYTSLGVFIIIIVVCLCVFLIYEKRKDNTTPVDANNEKQFSNSKQLESPLNYSIINIELNNKAKTIASVRISKKMTEFELRSIAVKVKSEISPKSTRVRLFFLLPGMKIGEGAWARADFNPDLRIYMIEQSIEDENSIISYKETTNKQAFLGLWNANLRGDFIYRLKSGPNGMFTLDFYSPSENMSGPLPAILKKGKVKGRKAFVDIDAPNEYYIIESNGDLSAYDERGLITTYRKI